MKSLLIIIALALIPSTVFGASHYVRPGGNGDGSSWTKAYSALPGTLTRGDTYYLAAGRYPAHRFADSGTETITIKKATSFDHGANEGWNSSYGGGQAVFPRLIFARSNYVLDGAGGGGPDSWKSGHGILIEIPGNSDNGIDIEPQISNLSFSGIEITQTGPTNEDLLPNAAIYTGDKSAFNLHFDGLYIHDLSGLGFYFGAGNNILVENSYFDDLCGAARANKENHCEHLVSRGLDGLVARYNIFRDGYSTGVLVVNDGGDLSPAENWEIYGNVFENNKAVPIVNYGPQAKNWRIFNNTITGGITEIVLSETAGTKIYNNLFDRTTHIYGLENTDHDHNTYTGAPAKCNDPGQTQFTIGYAPNENGRNGTCPGGTDQVISVPAASFTAPARDDFRLASALPGWQKNGTAVGGGGVNVCALAQITCDAAHPYDRDAWGNRRGADGVWDRGAYEFSLERQISGGGALAGACADLKNNLSFGEGEQSGVKRNEIIALQKFLLAQGLGTGKLTATGFFGRQTLSAVQAFQRTFLSPANVTGYVGPATREEIKAMTCE